MMENFNFADIEAKIGYEFKNKSLLLQAFTRSSYAAENSCEDNEVLEFIGDSVLGAVVAKRLAVRYFWSKQKENAINAILELRGVSYSEISPNQEFACVLDENEEELTQLKIELVQSASLAAATERMKLQNYLRMGRGDVAKNVQEQQSVKEDLFEAIVGAVAIDSGWNFEVLEELVETMLEIERLLEEGIPEDPDYVTELTKWLEGHGVPVEFKAVPNFGAEVQHIVLVNLGVNMLSHKAIGYGNTEQGAKRMAAKKALAFIRKTQNSANVVVKAVGIPTLGRAVNQLQELWNKKLIPEPQYVFEKDYSNVKNGNPKWACSCNLEGVFEMGGAYICESQKEGKKQAAYEVLRWLLGADRSAILHGKAEEVEFLGRKEVRLKAVEKELKELAHRIDMEASISPESDEAAAVKIKKCQELLVQQARLQKEHHDLEKLLYNL